MQTFSRYNVSEQRVSMLVFANKHKINANGSSAKLARGLYTLLLDSTDCVLRHDTLVKIFFR